MFYILAIWLHTDIKNVKLDRENNILDEYTN